MKKIIFISLLLGLVTSNSLANTNWVFGSSHDYFKVTQSGDRLQLNGQNVKWGAFSELLPLFDLELHGECSGLSAKPDLTVKRDGTTRHFYVEAKKISDGKFCEPVDGNGLLFIPLHRTWFTKPDQAFGFSIGEKFKLTLADKTTIEFAKENGEWITTNDDFFVDWNFFERFVDNLRRFQIDARLHPSAKSSAQAEFQVNAANKQYTFYLTGKRTWLASAPKVPWLISASRWAAFDDMSSSAWQDQFTPQLKKIANPELPSKARTTAMSELGRDWSRSVKLTLHKILLTEFDDQELVPAALEILKRHPSDDTFVVLVKTLKQTARPSIQTELTRVLRIRNPKGPIIKEEDTIDDQQTAIAEWTSWAQKTLGAKGL